MDLEWLLPQQIEQILKLCDLSSIQDPTLAANILEQHHWNLEFALHDLVQQNDDHQHIEAMKHPAATKPIATHQKEEYEAHDEGEFELDEEQYHQLGLSEPQPHAQPHRTLLAQQNREYEEMEKSYIAKLAQDQQLSEYQQLKDRQFSDHKEEFASHAPSRPIQIKFRVNGRVQLFAFDLSSPVEKVFKYVSGHLREEFDNKYAEFDLTQAFPPISLRQHQGETLEQVFGESGGEVLIVREL